MRFLFRQCFQAKSSGDVDDFEARVDRQHGSIARVARAILVGVPLGGLPLRGLPLSVAVADALFEGKLVTVIAAPTERRERVMAFAPRWGCRRRFWA